MKNLLLSFAIVLTVSIGMAFTGIDTQHLKGFISDSHCAEAKMDMGAKADRIKCVNKCIAGGASAVLVSGDKVYKISNQKAVTDYAGKDVEVDANVTNDTIEVTKIMEAK
ncbi:hypothetical protein [Mucilaginibacter sp. BT774]|uniref:hypothetical protein n=1 Tax=Mucilaginibacter sp. BT774 TaxID=3062276 RepID=UPI002675B451|nr:hypothetical protein [Mucilaginibacter sp. BT774]MDO3629109.1 hypothetical protein [Mucilaginibacter sp. BT774]